MLYVEPAKWVARLREVGADALLKCEMVAGHGGVSGRYNSWKERAFELAWLLDVLGLAPSDSAEERRGLFVAVAAAPVLSSPRASTNGTRTMSVPFSDTI